MRSLKRSWIEENRKGFGSVFPMIKIPPRVHTFPCLIPVLSIRWNLLVLLVSHFVRDTRVVKSSQPVRMSVSLEAELTCRANILNALCVARGGFLFARRKAATFRSRPFCLWCSHPWTFNLLSLHDPGAAALSVCSSSCFSLSIFFF